MSILLRRALMALTMALLTLLLAPGLPAHAQNGANEPPTPRAEDPAHPRGTQDQHRHLPEEILSDRHFFHQPILAPSANEVDLEGIETPPLAPTPLPPPMPTLPPSDSRNQGSVGTADQARVGALAVAAFDCTDVTEIPQTECEALVALYNSTAGANWTNQTGWLVTDTPCSWFGITCESGNVTEVELWGNNLAGPLPAAIGDLTALTGLGLQDNEITGTLPPELGNLTNLQSLMMWGNQLTGSLPTELGNLTNLQLIWLSHNQLEGTIPSQLGDMANLQVLQLHRNGLTGTIPLELTNLANLRDLELSWNQLTGSIPPEVSNLTNLERLGLGGNPLTGTIPSTLGNLTNLQVLDLYDNDLSGTIPVELANLSNLRELLLSWNQLEGALPSQLGNLANLQRLEVTGNSLTGSLPTTLTGLTQLTRFYFDRTELCEPSAPTFQSWLAGLAEVRRTNVRCSGPFTGCANVTEIPQTECEALVALYNSTDGPNWTDQENWLVTDIPCSWSGVSCTHSSTDAVFYVTALNRGYAGLVGTIPAQIGTLANLQTLYLYGNQLTTVPAEIGNLTNLNVLFLWENQLAALPAEIGNLANLTQLVLFDNQLTALPDLSNLTNLTWLSLSFNQLTTLPSWIGSLNSLENLDVERNQLAIVPVEISNLANLKYLYLGDNQLSDLPPVIGNLSQLVDLFVSGNQLSVLPAEIGNLSNLGRLFADNNQLTALPPTIGNLTNLTYLTLYSNQLTTLPEVLGNLTNLLVLSVGENQLSTLPTWIGNFVKLQSLSADSNQLTTLPAEIGTLTNLISLGLSGNQLTTLPVWIGNLTNLESLSLYGNQLTTLPTEIQSLVNLTRLSLGNNRLSTVPSGIANFSGLQSLDLSGNRINGTLPEWLGTLSLYFLDVSNHIGLTGPLPQSLTNYPYIDFYYTQTNLCAPTNPEFQIWFTDDNNYIQGNGLLCDSLTIRKRADSPRSPEGVTNGYTIEIYNPSTETAYLTVLTDTLPSVASYQTGSTTGFTTGDPTITGNNLMWSGSFAIAPTSAITLHFTIDAIDPSNVGVHYNSATGTAEDGTGNPVPVSTVQNVAPIEVPPPTVATNVNIAVETGSTTVDPATGQIDVTMPWGNRSDLTISSQASCPTPPGGTPTAVTLWHNFNSYTMSEAPAGSGSYMATIPAADVGDGEITVEVTCNGVLIENTVGTLQLYDPSGIISDATTGAPIQNATVTLYRVPGWRPDIADETRDCRTVDTRGGGWSQAAPTNLGVVMDAALEPAQIDPQVNPQQTNHEGRYGWNVVEGCWYIVIEAAGYQSKVSPVVGVPPEVTDLDVALTPIAGNEITLSISQSASGVALQWSGHPTATGYLVHRGDLPDFTPTAATQIATTTVGTTNYLDIATLPGDGSSAFYQVVATAGAERWPSNQVGKIGYALNNSGGKYALVGIPFTDPAVADAAALAGHIGNVAALLKWNPTTQTFRFFTPPNIGDNFPVGAGDAVFVAINSGGPASVSFVGTVETEQLPLTPGGYNFLSLPHQHATLTTAAAVAADLGGVTAMLSWNVATQTFRFFSPAGGGDNFAVVPGDAFILLVAAGGPTVWP